MPKIALLFLFAISGYGINGLPDNTNINVQPENDKTVAKTVVTNLDNTHLNDKTTLPEVPSSLSTKVPEKTTTETHTTISKAASVEKINSVTTKVDVLENVSTTSPMSESKATADKLDISTTTTGLPEINKSSAIVIPSNIPPHNDSSVTTVAPVITTPEPVVPVPAPKPGKWMVNETNQTCIIVNMAVQFNVSYINKENKTVSKLFNLPDNANKTVVTGECGKIEQYLRLSFNDTKNVTNNFTLHFVKNEAAKQYSFHHLEVALLNPNNTVLLVHNTTLVSGTGLSNSYRCLKQQNFTLALNGTDKNMGYLLISDLQFQAFKTENNKDFGEVKDCKLDTPDIVPIAVGCALAGLVVIVLIAYLMGRRRSQASGYSSM